MSHEPEDSFMHYYILDPGKLPIHTFEQLQVQLQGMLHEFNISGEFGRVTTLRTITDLVDTASSRGASTVVVCGNDDTLNQALGAAKHRDFVLGYIPLEPESSYIARIFGSPDIYNAVKNIAARRIVSLDTAKLGNLNFISFLEFGVTSRDFKQEGLWSAMKLLSKPNITWKLRIDDSYDIEVAGLGGLLVNSRGTTSKHEKIANPTDQQLDLLIMESMSKLVVMGYRKLLSLHRLEDLPNSTVIKCKQVTFLEPKGYPLTMLGRQVSKFPATAELTGKPLRIIVGKNRTF